MTHQVASATGRTSRQACHKRAGRGGSLRPALPSATAARSGNSRISGQIVLARCEASLSIAYLLSGPDAGLFVEHAGQGRIAVDDRAGGCRRRAGAILIVTLAIRLGRITWASSPSAGTRTTPDVRNRIGSTISWTFRIVQAGPLQPGSTRRISADSLAIGATIRRPPGMPRKAKTPPTRSSWPA